MGRSRDFYDEQERLRLEETFPNYLTLWTYDDVIQRAKRYHERIGGP